MAAILEKTLILGPEYDDALRKALRDVLEHLGAKGLGHDWAMAGSQEVETTEVLVGADRVLIEAETFVGLSICGPAELVEQIRDMTAARMTKS